MAYSYKCNLSFGLVFIPVKLIAAAKDNDIGFNMLDKKTMSRIKYVKTDSGGNKVEAKDIVKGYEYEDGKYVIFSDEDFEKIKTPSDKNISILCFVRENEIPPVYYNKPYYLAPSAAEKAFDVLSAAMKSTGMAAIAKTVLGTKETLVSVRAFDSGMLLNTLYYFDEIQSNPYVSRGSESGKEFELAKAIIEGMEEDFEPQNYKDEYRERILGAIRAKVDGKEIKVPSESGGRGISDLMEALKKSLNETMKKKPGLSDKIKKDAVKAVRSAKRSSKAKKA